MNIGWVGTGMIGSRMCMHLIENGHTLYVYNRTQEKAQELMEKGATWCDTIATLSEKCGIIFTIVGYPSDVEQVYLEADGILAHAKPGTITVDMTTSEPSLAKKIHQQAKNKGIATLDAPVSGGLSGAEKGTLSIMVGGDQETFDTIKPYFDMMGTTIELMGDPGAGQHTKACNQIAGAACVMGVAETLTYAKYAGLDLEQVIKIVGNGAGGSWMMQSVGSRMVNGDFNATFYVKHLKKDLVITDESAKKMELNLPLLHLARTLYEQAIELGYADLGFHAVYKLLQETKVGQH